MALHRHAEIHDLRLPRLTDEDVRRLEIEMDDAEVVDVVEARGDLQDHVVERVPVLPVEELGDLLSSEELHREIREAVVQQAEVEDFDDAGVLETRQRGELRLEPQELLRLGELMAEDLDGLVAFVGDVEDAVDGDGRGFLQHRADLETRRELERRRD